MGIGHPREPSGTEERLEDRLYFPIPSDYNAAFPAKPQQAMMRVHLTIDSSTPEGEAFGRELEAYADLLAGECACPGNRFCEVVVEEGLAGRYDVIIIRSGYAPASDNWFVIQGEKDCRFIRSFVAPSPEDVAAGILQIVETPLVRLRA